MHKSGVIEYKHDGYACEGFAVWDDAGAKRPGILVFPEWVGVGEYTHKRAQMLGDLGFNAFVVDVYGKGIRPNTPETCEAEMMKYATNRPLLRGMNPRYLTPQQVADLVSFFGLILPRDD